MRKSKNVGLVYGWKTYVLMVSALILLICAGLATAQTWGGYANTPGGQYQYAPYGQDSGQNVVPYGIGDSVNTNRCATIVTFGLAPGDRRAGTGHEGADRRR